MYITEGDAFVQTQFIRFSLEIWTSSVTPPKMWYLPDSWKIAIIVALLNTVNVKIYSFYSSMKSLILNRGFLNQNVSQIYIEK